ncbi:hypothetical protein EB796_022699 [Bugula neritina]|uniref:C-type lectin domain-containing protein n=1 Tax=Bugula neritina TaxID=10212 RepID=A0A7J7IYQ4_BUGNE|nr:hypothetical protein EB796_022699 [Bugula neritina]
MGRFGSTQVASLLIIAVTIFSTCTTADGLQCPPGYDMHYKPGQLCVYLSSDTATWGHAKAICENRGARVLILDTLEVIRWFSTQMSLKMETWLDRSIWMGGKADGGIWQWNGYKNNKFPIILSDFVSGKPDIVNPDKKCLAYHVGKINGWIDMDCSTKYYYACQIYINP